MGWEPALRHGMKTGDFGLPRKACGGMARPLTASSPCLVYRWRGSWDGHDHRRSGLGWPGDGKAKQKGLPSLKEGQTARGKGNIGVWRKFLGNLIPMPKWIDTGEDPREDDGHSGSTHDGEISLGRGGFPQDGGR